MNRGEVESMMAVAAIIGASPKLGDRGPGWVAAQVWQLRRIAAREVGRLVHECNEGPLQKHSLQQREKDRARLAEIAASVGVPMKLLDDADARGCCGVAVKCLDGQRGNSIRQDGWWRI